MIYDNLTSFFKQGQALLAKGPIAILLLEDDVEVKSTIEHHLSQGFKVIITFGPPHIDPYSGSATNVHHVYHDVLQEGALCDIVNGVIDRAPKQWIYYGYNAEYLFYPFCEDRTIGDVTTFSLEERRVSLLTYALDLYAEDLHFAPNGVCIETAHFDRGGYYGLARHCTEQGHLDQQMDIYGGLRWRFEEHVRFERRRIDRVSLFQAAQGLKIKGDYTFNQEQYNTYSCPWHNNLTATVCSFRTAKALMHNPGSSKAIANFQCQHSTPFEWTSKQLLELGFMETGQWF